MVSENRTILLQTTSNQGWQPFPIPGTSSARNPFRRARQGKQVRATLPAAGPATLLASRLEPYKVFLLQGGTTNSRRRQEVHSSLFFLLVIRVLALNSGRIFALVVKCYTVTFVCKGGFNFTIQQGLLKNSPVIHIALKKKKIH